MTNVSNEEKGYDFIVVGAGAAGSVLAAELSASGVAILGGNASRLPRVHSVVRERRFVNASLAAMAEILDSDSYVPFRLVCADRTCSESPGFKRFRSEETSHVL